MKQLPPILKTKKKAIAFAGFDNSNEKEIEEILEQFNKTLLRITRKHIENVLVLNFVLRELPTLKKGKKVGFDFGTNKEWELRRKK